MRCSPLPHPAASLFRPELFFTLRLVFTTEYPLPASNQLGLDGRRPCHVWALCRRPFSEARDDLGDVERRFDVGRLHLDGSLAPSLHNGRSVGEIANLEHGEVQTFFEGIVVGRTLLSDRLQCLRAASGAGVALGATGGVT